MYLEYLDSIIKYDVRNRRQTEAIIVMPFVLMQKNQNLYPRDASSSLQYNRQMHLLYGNFEDSQKYLPTLSYLAQKLAVIFAFTKYVVLGLFIIVHLVQQL